MTERNREVFQSDEEWFKNYIEHGGPPPAVTPKNHLGAKRALEAALTGQESLPGDRLDFFKRMIDLAKKEIKGGTFPPMRPIVLRELITNFSDGFLRREAVGADLDGVIDPPQASVELVGLLQEAASLKVLRAKIRRR